VVSLSSMGHGQAGPDRSGGGTLNGLEQKLNRINGLNVLHLAGRPISWKTRWARLGAIQQMGFTAGPTPPRNLKLSMIANPATLGLRQPRALLRTGLHRKTRSGSSKANAI